MGFNLAVILRESARHWPDKPALIFDDGQMTYGELEAASDRVAGNLRSRGVEPGTAVGLQLPNVPQFVIAYFGILKAGGVVVPMNTLLKSAEIGFYLGDSSARMLISAADLAVHAAKGAAKAGVDDVFVVYPAAAPGGAGDLAPFDELLAGGQPEKPLYEQRDPNDCAVLLYTSGTTGKPKGVQLSHFQLYMNADAHRQGFGMIDTDVMIAVAPMFHTLGLTGVMNATILAGGTLRLMQRFDAGRMFEAIERDRATIFHGVPTMYHALLNHPRIDDYDTSTLRVAGSAGAKLAPELMDSLESKLGFVILELYGLTESGPVATFNRRDDRRAYSVGKPIWGVDMEVWDGENRPLPPGAENVGEFVIRGHNVTKGYYRNPEATAEAFTDGWLRTGDLGYQDDDGFYFMVGRKKELIIRGGYNVYPAEIEDMMYTHPAVSEVAVLGVPDDRLGEEVKAYVTVKPGHSVTEQELVAFAKERIAAYKYPRSVEFLDEMPKGPSGKILKKELRAE
jgi:long-chain acyl-CoA synthetase